ncbi:Hemerythrin HHE cation binding domain protein [Catenulispora acidiphila DSM 44928]|uniref:Hemerythrin HHE cation binding domain protein n=1 Tax=Catenulispora acidiphila (strain DSM 44928 / JCM 14897 / NBRC 102108 / NRRL B-24433 / ID139908) TaxID=479433 RepID=C7Q7P0_CATAD|nr:hemerythrin domain-containing protein [Catenulispora acidiphila]ACU72233.1 Hemerythrin HHE cation binding domain protein [Catenulispora acidiphila DSM 44928]
MSATDRRDVIDVLTGEHRAVEALFQRLETGGGGPDGSRKSLVDALALELAWHAAAAQRYLLPLARRTLPDGDALADRHTAEHLTVEHMVRDLEAKDPSDARFEPLLAQLVAAARGHIEHEEQITFVELTRECDRGELLAAGEEMAAARRRAEAEAASATIPAQARSDAAGPGSVTTASTTAASASTTATPTPAPSVVDRVRAALFGA